MTLNFNQQLLLTIIDKGLIGIILLIIGFWIKTRIERLKGEEALRRLIVGQIASARSPAYLELWQLTVKTSPSKTRALSQQEKDDLFDSLTTWYYDKGNAIFLSVAATDLFLKARGMLKESNSSDQETTDAFSKLRTQLKVDMGVYSDQDARTQLPKPN